MWVSVGGGECWQLHNTQTLREYCSRSYGLIYRLDVVSGNKVLIQSRTSTFFLTYTGFYEIAEKPKLPVATALMVVPKPGRAKLALAPAPRTWFLGSLKPVQRLMFSDDWDQKYISADLVCILKPHSIKKNPVSGPFKQKFLFLNFKTIKINIM